MVWRLLCRFINCIKLAFPHKGSYRTTVLTQSDIFTLIEGCPQTTAKTDGFQTQVVKLWHIGIQYLVPFRPTFRDCNVSEEHLAAGAIEVEAWLTSSKLGGVLEFQGSARQCDPIENGGGLNPLSLFKSPAFL